MLALGNFLQSVPHSVFVLALKRAKAYRKINRIIVFSEILPGKGKRQGKHT